VTTSETVTGIYLKYTYEPHIRFEMCGSVISPLAEL